MNPWDIIGWLFVGLLVFAVAEVIIDWVRWRR